MLFGRKMKRRMDKIQEELRESHQERTRLELQISKNEKEIADLHKAVEELSDKLDSHQKAQDEITPSQILSEYLFGSNEEGENGGV